MIKQLSLIVMTGTRISIKEHLKNFEILKDCKWRPLNVQELEYYTDKLLAKGFQLKRDMNKYIDQSLGLVRKFN